MFGVVRSPSDAKSGMGCNLLAAGGASFRVWAPHAQAADVMLRPPDGSAYQPVPLARDPSNNEYWSADIADVAAGQAYWFRLMLGGGNAAGRVDPYAREVSGPNGNDDSYATDPAFAFAAFAPPGFSDYTIYQMQVGSFAGRNDDPAEGILVINNVARFTDAIKKLPHIARLGFNAVQFMPIGQYEPLEPEGYAPTDFFAPERDFGWAQHLRQLVDACHQQNMAVLFDVVYNHVPFRDNNLYQFDGPDPAPGGIYLASIPSTDWGDRPDLGRDPVYNFFLDNARMFFNEYKADGLRFDSAHNIYPANKMGALIGQLKQEFPGKLLIAEYDNEQYGLTNYAFDTTWDMNSCGDFIDAISNARLDKLKSLIDNPNVPHQYSLVRYLLGSHDQIYADYRNGKTDKPFNRYFVERVGGVLTGRSNYDARSKARMGWGLNIAAPGLPMMFMGTEVHHYGYWDPATDQFGDHRFDWALTRDSIGGEMMTCVTDANRVRAGHDALRVGSMQFTHLDPVNRVLAFKRWTTGGDVVLVVVNASGNKWADAIYGVGTSADGTFEEIFNSQSSQYGGWNDSGNYLASLNVQSDGKIYIRLPEWSTLIFRRR